MSDGRIAAVVLAAGGSTRLGRPKQLLSLADRPLLDYVVTTVRHSSVDARYIVLGHAAAEIRQQVSLDGFEQIVNPDYYSGQSTSVCAAIDAMPEDVSAVIFVLGDQPLLAQRVVDVLAQSYRENPAPIIQPQYDDGPGNPVLIDRSLFPELVRLTGDTGARPVLQERREEIRRVDCTRFERPVDVDTWEDFERVQASYASMTDEGDT